MLLYIFFMYMLSMGISAITRNVTALIDPDTRGRISFPGASASDVPGQGGPSSGDSNAPSKELLHMFLNIYFLQI